MANSYIVVVLLIVVVLVVGFLRWRQGPPAVQQMRREDGNDSLKRWARGCYAVVYGPISPEASGAADCREGLAEGWDIHTGEEALATVERLTAVPSGQVAWDLVRVVMVARLAAAAGLLSMDQAQAAVAKIQPRLQGQYSGWEEMAADYDRVVREKGFNEGHLKARPATRQIWAVVPFK